MSLRSHPLLSLIPLGAILVGLAGCGAAADKPQQIAGATPLATPPTVKPVPTPVITGGSVAAVVNG
ncbi:MAG: hypothetical protein ACRDFS_13520, partial [Chloroflexota bacterium]